MKIKVSNIVIYLILLLLINITVASARIEDSDLLKVNNSDINEISNSIIQRYTYCPTTERYCGLCVQNALQRYDDLTILMNVTFPVYVANIINYDAKFYHSVIAIQIRNDVNNISSYRFVQYDNPNIIPGDWQIPYNSRLDVIEVVEHSKTGFSGNKIATLYIKSEPIPEVTPTPIPETTPEITPEPTIATPTPTPTPTIELSVKKKFYQNRGATFIFGNSDIDRYCYFKEQYEYNKNIRALYYRNIILWENGFYELQGNMYERKFNIDCSKVVTDITDRIIPN